VAGCLLLIARIVWRDLLRRRAETVLLLLAITAATATLTLGLSLRDLVDEPYRQTRDTTAGPDVSFEPSVRGQAALDALAPIATADGVAAHSGPFPNAYLQITAHGKTTRVLAQGRDDAPVAVDRPAVTDGAWVRPGGAVVERTFAGALDLRVGDTVDVGGHPLRVVGFAVTAAKSPYPSVGWHVPGDVGHWPGGLVWVDRGDIASLAGDQDLSYVLNVKLANPAAVDAFVHEPWLHPRMRGWNVDLVSRISETNERQFADARLALVVGSWLLTLLALAGVAGIVAGRVIAQRRRVGLLKAVGAGPGTVALVHLAEYLVIGLGAAFAGLAAGWFAAPALFANSAGFVGGVGVRPPPGTAVAAVVLALTIAATAALVPVVRAAATDTVDALADSASPPHRRRWRILLSRRLPVALLIGVRINARRPRRARLVTANTLITTTAIAALLTEMARDHDPFLAAEPGLSDLPDPKDASVVHAMLLVFAVVCLLALVNTIVSTWTAVLDARHPLAVARALGATPGQAGMGLALTQVLPALPGALVGIPMGFQLYSTFSRPDPVPAPAWWMAAAALGVLAAVVALTAVPAFAVARRPVADGL
jgi:putative ABC transport system permease protein